MIPMLVFLLIAVFVLGAIMGSLLNVCIYRIPQEKSIIWPGSRCGHCFQPIRWHHNIPLLSYLFLRGRCGTCGTKFSARYFLVELLTGLIFVGLFYLEVLYNIHDFTVFKEHGLRLARLVFPTWQGWIVFGFHAVFVSFLIVATFCDLDQREIPLSLTVSGTAIGLMGAVFFPWPWPDALPVFAAPNQPPPLGLYPWPVWSPLPAWLPPGSWQLGLATGLVGLLAGTMMLRVVRFVFTAGLGVEALGLGDADLMMMAGAFLGWQPLVVAFFISVGPGLFFALLHMALQRVTMRKSVAIAGKAHLENGQIMVSLDGQSVDIDQVETAVATLVHDRHKSVLALDPTGLETFVDDVVTSVRASAKQAGIRKVYVPSHDVPPGWLTRLFAFLFGFGRRRSRISIQAEAFMQDGKAAFRIDGVPVLPEDLSKSLASDGGQRHTDLIIDSTGMERWLEQTLTRIRLAARQAGIARIQMHDRTIPFGPALAVGLVVAMLCWKSIGRDSYFVFFHAWLVFGGAGVCCILMLACSYFIRVSRLMRR